MAQNQKRQTSLSLKLAGSGGGEPLKLVRLDAYEALSEPFMISIDVLSKSEIKLLDNIGKSAGLESLVDGQTQRYFHGVIIDGQFVDDLGGAGLLYRLNLSPASHFHEQGSNFRIFQKKSPVDIIKIILERCKIDFIIKASGGTRQLPYCVQYGESDFAFACRLMEEEGLYYFYEHKLSSHTLTICDKPGAHKEQPDSTLEYNPSSSTLNTSGSNERRIGSAGTFIQNWIERASSGAEQKVTLRDYDFKQPAKSREAEANDKGAHDHDDVEVYNWPGRFYDNDEGKALGTFLLESRRAQRLCYEGSGGLTGVQVGFTFTLQKHPVSRFNRKYLVIRCRTQTADEQFRSGVGSGETYSEFTCIHDDVQFRAPIVTPRPYVRGLETAVVTGPDDEEIYVDEYGRVKVQFHWDRVGKLNDESSCWIRVSQTGGLGNIILPRIGHEVLVDFVNGNPDRPIVVGRVFNATHKPVYTLPDHKTRALWRTKTYKQDTGSKLSGVEDLDTGAPGANELRFEDATGKEEVFVHAERDMNTRVRNDETHHVGKDVEIKVGKNRTETVGSNETITIKADRIEEVKGTETVTVTGDRSVTIKSNDSQDVTQKITIKAGTEIEICANTKITLKVGSSSITLDPTSIKISTTMLEMTGQATAKLAGALTNVEAQGILTAKGGLVMIN